ncbi:hypothetical protein K470DRAFT_268472 [Piedraia hortae CBS 480.64]|uniref:Zn(2)-C6 fungal-type domain-containing protein n=1 Tax=Piedraia hortae CBS 480.64 TaxID=1314780 RepID=A0A6A7C7D6_9PEZI|nr:hypothetical protein K470DRAFT_268472 [Piedraia hortae CBS 480.64]
MSASPAEQPKVRQLRFVTNYGAPHPKRRRITAACLTCRKRKTACSGERPFCEKCRLNSLECAGYSTEPIRKREPPKRPPDVQTKEVEKPPFSRNRMPYFRWLGPTAIMPGFKQMVVKVEHQDSDLARSSTDGITSPQPDVRRDATAGDLEGKTALELPFYDTSTMPPSELLKHLVQVFFTHLGCNYPFLQRDRFLHDLQEKQVDAILVDAVCALAARFSTHTLLTQQNAIDAKPVPADHGHAFAQRAKAALVHTFSCPSVAAVQAALLLAYNEFGESRDSGLWVYLGLAIRMAQDLGLHKIEGLKYVNKVGPTPRTFKYLSTEEPAESDKTSQEETPHEPDTEQEAVEQERVDTFWAVFFLDRVVSSGTGRPSTLRDKDIELPFPPLQNKDSQSEYPSVYPALVRIVHLYGRVADLLNSIKEPSDIRSDTSQLLASMETQVTNFYQGLPEDLHFDAIHFRHYVDAGEGTNFMLLHLWFHALIVLLHQPTLLKTFEGKMLQLFPNSQQLSMSSAKTIVDILSYANLMHGNATLGNPFTTQPIYIAACAFLNEKAAQTATSNAQSRVNSPSSTKETEEKPLPEVRPSSDQKSISRHTLLATAASQHYQLCHQTLETIKTYWSGTKYILTILDQKFQGVDDPLLYTVEEGESSIETPFPVPAFTSPGWRRKPLWEQAYIGASNKTPVADPSNAARPFQNQPFGWTLTGTINSPSTNLAWHYSTGKSAEREGAHSFVHYGPPATSQGQFHNQPPYSSNNIPHSDADLLLALNSAHYPREGSVGNFTPLPSTSGGGNLCYMGPAPPHMMPMAGAFHQHDGSNGSPPVANGTAGPGEEIMIESHDIDMSMLGLDSMPWFDLYATMPNQHPGEMDM